MATRLHGDPSGAGTSPRGASPMAYRVEFGGWYQGPASEPLYGEPGPIPRDATTTGAFVQAALDHYHYSGYDPEGVIGREYPDLDSAQAALATILGPDGSGVRPIVGVVAVEWRESGSTSAT